jgi:hypothetical protein
MPKDENDEIWPHGESKAKTSDLIEFVKELADEKTKKEVEKIESESAKLEKIANSNGHHSGLRDMPESVLDGRLGELCMTHMLLGKRFPLAYAWPALLAVASTLTPRHGPKQRLNLFVALSGPVHTGKTQAIEAATQLLGLEAPQLMEMLAGSAEQLARKCADAKGEPRLFAPDELGHTLEKSHIENASFPYIFNVAFYKTRFEIRMGKKENSMFDTSLSVLGGVVDSRFDDLFSHSSTGGLYDRFMFGACPSGFRFSYFPFETEARRYDLTEVGVAPEVWVEKELWLAEDRELEPRVVEIAIRAAITCASFDGKTLLTAKDLGPAYEMAKYQQRIRRYLRPNEGENPEAKIAVKMQTRLKDLGGKCISKRELFHNCGAERCGLTIANRALTSMHANGDIHVSKERPILVRWLVEENEREEEAI